jgi:hypothetical protein
MDLTLEAKWATVIRDTAMVVNLIVFTRATLDITSMVMVTLTEQLRRVLRR